MKKMVFLVLFFMVLTGAFAQSTPVTKNSINGTWELQTNSGLYVIYFSTGGVFVLYKDGNYSGDGTYSISSRTPNQPQTVTLHFGIFDRMSHVYNVDISNNELVLSDGRSGPAGSNGNITEVGRYRRSSFVQSEAGNPLIGTWKSASEIYRFYRGNGESFLFSDHRRNGQGTLFRYQNEPEFTEEWRFRITYEFTNASRTNGNITLWGFDENYKYGAFVAYPFVINGNIFRVQYEGGTVVFIRQNRSSNASFSSGFIGTWKRDNFDNVLTFTTNTFKASNQDVSWTLDSISNDEYTIIWEDWYATTITIKLVNNNIIITGDKRGSDEDNWNGTWKRQ